MSEDKLVASDGQEVTDAMIEGWCEAYDEGRLPDGYAVDGGVRKGHPGLSTEGTASMTARIPRPQKKAPAREADGRRAQPHGA